MATNPIENSEEGPGRSPRNMRGIRGGFSSVGVSASSSSESLRTSQNDEVDDLTDPNAMRDRVIAMAPARVPNPPNQGYALGDDDDDEGDGGTPDGLDPRRRMNEVAAQGSAAYTREYRLSLLGRMLMRNVPLDQIAQQFQVSVSTIEKDRAELRQRLRQKARDMNIDEYIGGQTELYDEVSGMALRISSSNAPVPMKLAAMRTTLAANADKTRMLQSTGVLDVLRYRRAATESEMSDVQMLMASTKEMMAALMAPEEPVEAKPRRVTRTPPGGFKAFSMDDANASGSDKEVTEL